MVININAKNQVGYLYSFDIFDTLVTRRVATPSGIFALIQEQLKQNSNISQFVKNNFYMIRVGAEDFARHKAYRLFKHFEITIDDIYSVIESNYNLSCEEAEFIKNIEITTEIKNLLPINKNLFLLKDLISEHKRVVLISDMYYGESYLKQILSHIDSIFNNLKIYSSADYKVSKADGGLYDVVKKRENVYCRDWIHYGDNKQSDIRKAQKHGITAIYSPQIELSQYEKLLLDGNESNLCYQIVIGSAKVARLLLKTDNNNDKYNFGASFAGPILYNYVDWTLSQAIEKGFETLYFVARDGFIPKIIADIIIKKRNLPIRTKYIYGSRLAWREMTDTNYDSLIDCLFEEYSDRISAEFLGYRLGVDAEKVAKMLGLSSVKAKIKTKFAKECAGRCKRDSKIKTELLDASKKRVDLLKKYLKQEIDFSTKNIAFVDLHGSGRTQDCIATILNQIQPCKLYCFYLTNSFLDQTDISIKFSYFSTFKYLSPWIELLGRNTDGQTIGYKDSNGIIEAVTEKGNGQEMLKWGFKEYLDGIKNYTNCLLTVENINNINTNELSLYCKYFDYLMNDLDKNTAVILGDIPFRSIGKEDNECVRAASRIPSWKLLSNFVLCKRNNLLGEFPYLSIARSSKFSSKLQKLMKTYPTLQKFLFNVYIHKKERKAYVRILGIKISFGRVLWRQ